MKDDIKIIGICGPAQAGKDTFAKNITKILVETTVEEYADWVIATESFAAPIKSMVAMLLDFFGKGSIMNPATMLPYLEGDLKEIDIDIIGASPRTLMQTLGTDWGRKMIDEDIWMNSMRARIEQYGEAKKHGHQGAFVLISDVRFDNEAEMIRAAGGEMVRITAGERALPDVVEHDSERGISEFLIDATIVNFGTHEEFINLTASYLTGLLGVNLVDDTPPTIVHIPPASEDAGTIKDEKN